MGCSKGSLMVTITFSEINLNVPIEASIILVVRAFRPTWLMKRGAMFVK